MKALRRVLVGLVLCFTFAIFLASCASSNVSKSYADRINNAYSNGTVLKYETVKQDLGEECIDVTTNQNGVLIAVKGLTAGNYKERLDKASPDEKFEFISITVVQGNCQRAYYSTGTASEILAGIKR